MKENLFRRPACLFAAAFVVATSASMSQTSTYASTGLLQNIDSIHTETPTPLAAKFLYENDKYVIHSAGKDYSVGARRSQNNNSVLRFEVKAGDRASFDKDDRDRSEATDSVHFPMGEVVWNAYRVKVADGFAVPSEENSWFIIGQWHGSANDNRSPYIAAQMQGNDLVFLRRFLSNGKQTAREMYRMNNVPRNEWLNIVIEHKVSETDGLLNIWLNGSQVVKFEGPLGYWDHQDAGYWKFGIYRSATDTNAVVEYRDVVTTTKDLSKRAMATN